MICPVRALPGIAGAVTRIAVFVLFLLPFQRAVRAQDTGGGRGGPGSGDSLIPAHDPVMIREDSVYYLFCTGKGIGVWSSKDRKHWKREAPVFARAPDWTDAVVPGFRNHIWAPDISRYKGKYYLYYSVSAFGKNTSAIGLATNATLDPTDPGFKWVDHGKIIQSIPERDNWNAIDPHLVHDEKQAPWLAFGSFWSGIKLVKLNADLMSVASPREWYAIASRSPRSAGTDKNGATTTGKDIEAGSGAIEAPFIFRRKNYYYLFVSFDYCCRGINSTYKIMVGRARNIRGPYRDRTGKKLSEGGGTLVLGGNADWHGVGHNAVCTFDGTDYLVFQGYDALDEGRAKLLIRPLHWDREGWPVARLKK